MNRLITRKPLDDTKLKFAAMGKKPKIDVENAADAKKPGDAKEDSADQKKNKTNPFAKKAAATLSGGDVGKKNNGTTTGFSAVEKSAQKEGYSPVTAQKIAGAQFQKMKKKGQL